LWRVVSGRLYGSDVSDDLLDTWLRRAEFYVVKEDSAAQPVMRLYHEEFATFLREKVAMLVMGMKTCGDGKSPLEDLAKAIQDARRENPPRIEDMVRNCVSYSSLMTPAPPLIIDVLAWAGQLRRAELIAEKLDFPLDRCRAYCHLAERAWAQGDRARGREYLKRATQAARLVLAPSYGAAAWYWVITVLHKLGYVSEAQKLARQSVDWAVAFIAHFASPGAGVPACEREHLLFWTAKSVRLALDESALAELRLLVPYEGTTWWPWNVSLQLAAAWDDRPRLKKHFDDDSNRQPQNLALALAEVGMIEKARKVIRRIQRSGAVTWPDGEKRLIWARAKCGDIDGALDAATRIDHPEEAARALDRVQRVAFERDLHHAVNRAADLADELLERLERKVDELQADMLDPEGPEPWRTWHFSADDLWRIRVWVSQIAATAGRRERALQLAETVCDEGIASSPRNCLTFPTHHSQGRRGHVYPVAEPLSQVADESLYADLRSYLDDGRLDNARSVSKRMTWPRFRALGMASLAAALPDAGEALEAWLDALNEARCVDRKLLEEVVKQGVPVLTRAGYETTVERLPEAIASGSEARPSL
jgi:tetratricopeptide (TPR) repeat protein